MSDLLARLRTIECGEGAGDYVTQWYRNPDGPEAASEIERLRRLLRRKRLTKCERHLLDVTIDSMDPDFGAVVVPDHQLAVASAIHSLLVRVRKCL